MNTYCTYASNKHLEWLLKYDPNINKATIKKKIANQEIILIQSKNEILGYLRFGITWDDTPTMFNLKILKKYRNQGFGSQLINFWELKMKEQGFELLMTTTQKNKTAQEFYRKLNYIDAGHINFPDEPPELILLKKI